MAKFYKPGVWDKVPQGRTLIFEDFPYDTAWDRWKKAFMPKTSSIRPVVSIQYRLVTDGQTDGHVTTAYTALA